MTEQVKNLGKASHGQAKNGSTDEQQLAKMYAQLQEQAVDNKRLQDQLAQLTSLMATLTVDREKAIAAQREAEQTAERLRKQKANKGSNTRHTEIFGHSATSIMRALRLLGAEAGQVNRAFALFGLRELGINLTVEQVEQLVGYIGIGGAGVSTQLARADKWSDATITERNNKEVKQGKPASITFEQAQILCQLADLSEPKTEQDWFTPSQAPTK